MLVNYHRHIFVYLHIHFAKRCMRMEYDYRKWANWFTSSERKRGFHRRYWAVWPASAAPTYPWLKLAAKMPASKRCGSLPTPWIFPWVRCFLITKRNTRTDFQQWKSRLTGCFVAGESQKNPQGKVRFPWGTLSFFLPDAKWTPQKWFCAPGAFSWQKW